MSREAQNREKQTVIFDAALALLRDGGAEALTMRKIATAAGISLGNLQYHFKNKEALLSALMDRFLDQYRSDYWQNGAVTPPTDLRAALADMLHHESYDDCAIVFKEAWALAERNGDIANALSEHYRQIGQVLAAVLLHYFPESTASQRERVAGLIVTVLEGYCVTGKAGTASATDLAEILAQTAEAALATPV